MVWIHPIYDRWGHYDVAMYGILVCPPEYAICLEVSPKTAHRWLLFQPPAVIVVALPLSTLWRRCRRRPDQQCLTRIHKYLSLQTRGYTRSLAMAPNPASQHLTAFSVQGSTTTRGISGFRLAARPVRTTFGFVREREHFPGALATRDRKKTRLDTLYFR